MENKKRYSIKNILLTTVWVALGASTIVLLVAAIRIKDEHRCKGIEISIEGVNNNFFVDKKDILRSITAIEQTNPVGKTIGSFNLKLMEAELEKDVWIKGAELFFDNNEILQVNVQEREPIARVFTTTSTTFYIDHELAILPLSEKFSARLPVFTNFPSDRKVLSKADSSLLMEVRTISLAIQKDSFSMAMIEQVDITPQRSFEMIPKIGKQLIVFGDANEAEEKLKKLKLFYKEIMIRAGWNNYSLINVQYKNQVVAKIKGAEDIAADSLRTLQIMRIIVERAQLQAADSLQVMQKDNKTNTVDSTMIQQSIQRDDNEEIPNAVENQKPETETRDQPVLNTGKAKTETSPTKQTTKPAPKPVLVKQNAQQPKAVMQKKNDYAPNP